MSQLANKFTSGLKNLKVKEVAPYAGEFAKTNLAPRSLAQRLTAHVHEYKAHLDAGSAKPLFDTMALLFVGAYALAWPTEYAHMKAEQAAKLEGKAAH